MSGSKLLRLCSLFLCLLLCLANFFVVANAGEAENLVDSNLSNWTDFGDESEYFQSANVSYLDNNVNYIEVQSSDTSVYLFDITEFLKVGESYNFTFSLPTTGGANSNSLNSCDLNWFLTDGGGDLYPTFGNDVFQISINNSNKSNYLGKSTTFEFTYTQGFKNTFLCLSIVPAENLESYNDLELYISNISLERVASESEKKLDGILSWLEDIKNSITGLGDKLTSVWENITSSVSNLGDRISGFFSELSNTISTKFNELTTNFSNFITNLGDRISGFFDNLITNVKTFFEELPRKIFNYEIEVTDDDTISDGSGSDVEEEEPSEPVRENLLTLSTFNFSSKTNLVCNFHTSDSVFFRSTGSSMHSFWGNGGSWLNSFFEPNRTYRVTFKISDWAVLADNYPKNNYLQLDYYTAGGGLEQSYIYYSGNGVYSQDLTFSTYYNFRPRFCIGSQYEFVLSDFAIYDVTDEINSGGSGDSGSEEEGTTTKVSWFQYLINKFKSWFNSIIDSVKGFFIKLVDDIKGLFIPPDGFFEEWKAKFDLMLSDNLGFIYQAPNFVTDIVEVVQEILQSDQEVNLVFPAVEFDIAGYHIELFKDTKVDFSFLEAGIWLTLYSMYKVMLYVIFALALIKYGMSTWERTMAN